MRKLSFLSKLLSNSKDSMNSRVFTTLAIEDVYSVSLVSQCRMLEEEDRHRLPMLQTPYCHCSLE